MSPAVSRAQQQSAGLALSAKRKEIPVSKLKGAAKSMYNTMTVAQLKELAETPTKKLPKKRKK